MEKYTVETYSIPEIDNSIKDTMKNIANFRSKQIDDYFLPFIPYHHYKNSFVLKYVMKYIYKFEIRKIWIMKEEYILKRFWKIIARKII